jgi:DNA-binding beta-propeller fold protein YncE
MQAGSLVQLPGGVATDGSGNVYVADTNNNRIQKFACP